MATSVRARRRPRSTRSADGPPAARRGAGDRDRRRRARPTALRTRRVSGQATRAPARRRNRRVPTDVGGQAVAQNVVIVSGGRAAVRDARRRLGREVRRCRAVHRRGTPSRARPAGRSGRHEQPGIYVLGPPARDVRAVERALRRLGPVKRIQGATPVENAIVFARYSDGDFGWGVRDPGHGLVFANTDRTQDAAAAAAARRAGKYGPLLLLDRRRRAPPPAGELPARHPAGIPVRPGARGVQPRLDHGRRVCDRACELQARIDELAEIVRVRDEDL